MFEHVAELNIILFDFILAAFIMIGFKTDFNLTSSQDLRFIFRIIVLILFH